MVNFKTTLMYPQFFQKRTKIFEITIMIKFKYSEKATIFCEISSLDLSYVVMVKYIVKISQNCVAFSEYMNFTSNNLFLFFFWKNLMTPKRHFEINWPITFKILKYFLYLFHPVTFFFSSSSSSVNFDKFSLIIILFFFIFTGLEFSTMKTIKIGMTTTALSPRNEHTLLTSHVFQVSWYKSITVKIKPFT